MPRCSSPHPSIRRVGTRFRRARSFALATSLLAVVLLAGCGSHPSHRSGSPTTPPGIHIPLTPPVPAGAGYLWTRDTSPALTLGGGPTAALGAVLPPALAPGTTGQVAGTGSPIPGSHWLIAGTTTGTDGRTTATVWTSSDAVAWAATALTGPGTDSRASAATRWGDRTLIVGSVGVGSERRAAVWFSSTTGAPFVPVAAQATLSAPAGAGGGAQMDVVAAGALGVFAAGTTSGQETMWYSTDGRHWTRLSGADGLLAGSVDAHVRSLLVAPTGVFAAGDYRDAAATDGAVWTSTDGVRWQPVSATTGVFSGGGDHTVAGLVQLGTSFVAVGAVRSGGAWSPASWISPDGLSWDQPSQSFPISSSPNPDPTGMQLAAVSGTANSLVAVGGSRTSQRVWTSQDGTSWSEVALPANAAAATDWHLGLVASSGPTTVVVDNQDGQPHVLSGNGAHWQELSADPATFGAVQPSATPGHLVATAHGLVLMVNVTTPSQVLGPDTHTAVVLTSPDGAVWTPAVTGMAFAHATVDDVAPTAAGGLIAAGTSDAAPGLPGAAMFWISPTGTTWAPAPANPGVLGGGPAGAGEARGVAQASPGFLAVGHGPIGSGGTGPAGGAGSTSADTSSGPAMGFASLDGATWSSTGTLDPHPGLGDQTPEGVCTTPTRSVAVGTGTASQPGRQALAWSATPTGSWRRATVTPTPAAGADEAFLGCVTSSGGLTAYGEATASDGSIDAALWHSPDGVTWTRQSVSGFTDHGQAPITDLAIRGGTWLATSGTGSQPDGAAAGVADGVATHLSLSTSPKGAVAIWRSTDGGSSWEQLDTNAAAWQARSDAQADQVALVADGPVVAGTVDGQLAVWFGTTSGDANG